MPIRRRFIFSAFLLSAVAPLMPARAQPAVESTAAKPVIILTYPAVVTDDAAAAIDKDFMKARWPDSCSGFLTGDACDHNDQALSEAVAKTLYYLPDAVAAVQKIFPNASVVTMPARLSRGEGGGFIYQSSDPELPAALRIDFMTHASTRTVSSGPSFSSTNGLFVVPVFVVWSGAKKFTQTGGLVATNKGIGPAVPNLAADQPSALLHLLAKGRKAKDKTAQAAEVLEARQYKLNDDEWSKLKANGQGELVAERIFEENLKPAAAQVTDGDLQLPQTELAAYEKLYPQLLTRPDGAEDAAEFAATEAEFMRYKADQDVGQLRGSDFDKSMSILIAAEREHNKKAERMNWIAALTIVGAGFLNQAKGGSFGLGELQQIPAYETQMQQVQSAFSENFAPVSARQYRVAVRMGGKESHIQARSVSELRHELAGTIARPSATPIQAAVVDGPSITSALPSVADELRKLADLRDRGVITDAEFQAQKARLLGESSVNIPTAADSHETGASQEASAAEVRRRPSDNAIAKQRDDNAVTKERADNGGMIQSGENAAGEGEHIADEATYQRALADWQAKVEESRKANEYYEKTKAEIARQENEAVEKAEQERADWERRVAACKGGDYSQCATQAAPQ